MISSELRAAYLAHDEAVRKCGQLVRKRDIILSDRPPVLARGIDFVLERFGGDPNGLQRIAQRIQDAEDMTRRTRLKVVDAILETPGLYNSLPTVKHYQGVVPDKPGYLKLSFEARFRPLSLSNDSVRIAVERNFEKLGTRWVEGNPGVETSSDGPPVVLIPADSLLVIPSFSLDGKLLGHYPVQPANLKEGVITASEVNKTLRSYTSGQFIRIR